ncbi:MAG: fibronectin type III domain-containing protein, partial [Candidatus Eisenbacteria bacterium]|nr:fibronectin type III domain-containing protein [Candidatus Eisenbacteria bacterium]
MKSDRSWRWLVLVCAAFSLPLQACTVDREDADYDNPYDPGRAAGIGAPESVRIVVGDGVVHLSWTMPDGETAEEYTILRKTPDVEAEKEERILATVQNPQYRDARVRNGRLYVYRIAAGRDGRFGERTDELEARPALCSILLDQDHRFTKERTVAVTATASSATAVRLGEDPQRLDGPWRSASGAIDWQLTGEDGEKTVYAEFLFEDGSTSEPVSDTITLDTRAVIEEVGFDGPSVRRMGERIHVQLRAGETEGTASVTVDGILQKHPLFDDGTGGDPVAGDGVYEADCTLSARDPVTRAAVKGAFTDRAGNAAPEAQAAQLLTVQHPLEAVSILSSETAEPPDAPSVKVRWSRFEGTGFASYRLYR